MFRTVKPKYYPIPVDGPVGDLLNNLDRHPYRPAHVHFMVKANGYKDLVTHALIEGGKYLESDTVFAVKKSLIRKLEERIDKKNNDKCFFLNFLYCNGKYKKRCLISTFNFYCNNLILHS